MNWDAAGAIGEIVGAFAVLATLIYLAKQIRHSTDVSKVTVLFPVSPCWTDCPD